MNSAVMHQLLGWISAPATGWVASAALTLGLVAGSQLAPQTSSEAPQPSWQAQQRAPAAPVIHASGQRLSSPQKWVF